MEYQFAHFWFNNDVLATQCTKWYSLGYNCLGKTSDLKELRITGTAEATLQQIDKIYIVTGVEQECCARVTPGHLL